MNLSIIAADTTSDWLAREARARSCTRRQLASALLSCIASSDMADAVLDGLDPSLAFADPVSPQVRIMRALPEFRAPNGTYLFSLTDMSTALGSVNRGAIRNAIHRLIAKRLLILIEPPKVGRTGHPSRYELTEAGLAFIREIETPHSASGPHHTGERDQS